MSTLTQFVMFCLVGLVNTALHALVFVLLFRLLGVHYLAATAAGYSAGVLNSFVLNRRWTFRRTAGNRRREMSRFVVVNLVSLGINVFALHALVAVASLTEEVALLLAIGCSTTANFAGNKYWTFQGAAA